MARLRGKTSGLPFILQPERPWAVFSGPAVPVLSWLHPRARLAVLAVTSRLCSRSTVTSDGSISALCPVEKQHFSDTSLQCGSGLAKFRLIFRYQVFGARSVHCFCLHSPSPLLSQRRCCCRPGCSLFSTPDLEPLIRWVPC